MTQEALKLALKALNAGEHAHLIMNTDGIKDKVRRAIAELESQEPYGWVKIDEVREHFGSIGCGTIYKTAGEDRVSLYTHPPQRTWVGLTDDEMFELWLSADEQKDHMAFGKAVETKLKEKNT